MTNDVFWLGVGLALGIPIGLMFREAFDLICNGDKELKRMRSWLRRNTQTLTLIALVIAIVFTGVIGIIVMVSNNDRAQLTACLSRYNEATGNARDERTRASNKVADAEAAYVRADVAYQRGLLSALGSETTADDLTAVVRARLAANERYLSTLDAAKKVRAENEYPPPNLCENP